MLSEIFVLYLLVQMYLLMLLKVEKGELTNTLKVKRPVLNEHYKEQIAKMYEE